MAAQTDSCYSRRNNLRLLTRDTLARLHGHSLEHNRFTTISETLGTLEVIFTSMTINKSHHVSGWQTLMFGMVPLRLLPKHLRLKLILYMWYWSLNHCLSSGGRPLAPLTRALLDRDWNIFSSDVRHTSLSFVATERYQCVSCLGQSFGI